MGRYKNNKDGTLDLIAGSGDTSSLANKTDISSIQLTGTTNTSGSTITAGTWFYLNGTPCIAKVDIASGATFTLNTNYEEKTVGSALSELNSNTVSTRIDISSYNSSSNKYIAPSDGYFSIVCPASGQYARGILYNSYLGVSTGHNGTFTQSQTYVKKGCDIWVTDVTGSPEIYFFPLS